ncbi:MAG TPA: thioredoxin family protein [Burkholderiaceae bacterium]|jgi:thioredoxin-like negative regulator of GroEL
MKALAKIFLAACVIAAPAVHAAGVSSAGASPPLKPVYNEQADARAELNVALAQAHAQKKNVLVVFGANWCPDCRSLSDRMSGPLARQMDRRFVVLKVDVGRFTKNLDLAEQMGVPLKKGIPAVAVLKNNGEMASATSGGELADARSMGDEAVLKVFDGLKAN